MLFGKRKKIMQEIEYLKSIKEKQSKENFLLKKENDSQKIEIKNQTDSIEKQKKIIEKQKSEIDSYNQLCHSLTVENRKLCDANSKLKKKKRELQGSKGGLKAENNKLKEMVKDLTIKLEESMTDKYLVKRIPSGRKPKGPAIKLRSYSKQSQIIKNIHKD